MPLLQTHPTTYLCAQRHQDQEIGHYTSWTQLFLRRVHPLYVKSCFLHFFIAFVLPEAHRASIHVQELYLQSSPNNDRSCEDLRSHHQPTPRLDHQTWSKLRSHPGNNKTASRLFMIFEMAVITVCTLKLAICVITSTDVLTMYQAPAQL